MGRSPCCEKEGLKKGPWTPEEDQKLLAYIEQHGHGSWRALPAKAGLQRCGKSCRLRWTNYLRPDIKRGKFSVQEEQTIIQLHALLGNRWSAIASHLPKRTDNEIKNFWNTHLKKRLAKMGIDPVTHKPRRDAMSSAAGQGAKSAANLSHMAQWESARLEAEARLVRESKLRRSSSAAASSVTSLSSSSNTAPFHLPPPNSATSAPAELRHMMSSPPSPSSVPAPCFDATLTWQSTVAVGGGGHNAQTGQIDLESPTSTLSFSESFLAIRSSTGLAGDPGPSATQLEIHRSSAAGSGGAPEEMDGEDADDWKHFPEPMQLFDQPKDIRAESFILRSSTLHADVPWLHEPPSKLEPAALGNVYGDGFTELLLDESDRHIAPEHGGEDFAAGERGGEVEEESKGYWSCILNLVNTSSLSNSPAGF